MVNVERRDSINKQIDRTRPRSSMKSTPKWEHFLPFSYDRSTNGCDTMSKKTSWKWSKALPITFSKSSLFLFPLHDCEKSQLHWVSLTIKWRARGEVSKKLGNRYTIRSASAWDPISLGKRLNYWPAPPNKDAETPKGGRKRTGVKRSKHDQSYGE